MVCSAKKELHSFIFSSWFRDHKAASLSLRPHHHDLVMSPASVVSNRVISTSWHSVGVVVRYCVCSYTVHMHTHSNPTYPMYSGGVLLWSCYNGNWHQSTFLSAKCVRACVVSNSCRAPVGWQEEWQASILSIPEGQTLSPQETTPTPFTQLLLSDGLKRQLFRNKLWNCTDVSLIPCEITFFSHSYFPRLMFLVSS